MNLERDRLDPKLIFCSGVTLDLRDIFQAAAFTRAIRVWC
jgi:hypothetical protein